MTLMPLQRRIDLFPSRAETIHGIEGAKTYAW